MVAASMGIHLFGASVHSAPLDVLERLALSPEREAVLRERLGPDTLILSTCNRTEIYIGDGVTQSPQALRHLICEALGTERGALLNHLYSKSGVDGIRHLYRVACGLDSAVLGEAQILGQVREAWDVLREMLSHHQFLKELFPVRSKLLRRRANLRRLELARSRLLRHRFN